MSRTPDPDTILPILGVRAGDVHPRVLVVGDPERVADVATHLDHAVEIGRSREYVTSTGTYDGVGVTVASHGVGAAGAAICFEELCRAGITHLVRAGTCGGLQEAVVDGDLVVGVAAVRDDGLTDRLVPDGWPAVADPALTLALAREAAAAAGTGVADTATSVGAGTGHTVHSGTVLTTADFYASPLDAEPRWRRHHRAGALAIEMEHAPLLVVAQQHGVAAGGIFAVDGNLLGAASDMSDYDPNREVVAAAKAAMIPAALRALTTA